MSQYTSPYINFQGRAREAMEFYHGLLGGELNLVAFDDQGTPRPAQAGERIMHSHLEADGARLMGTDGHPDYPATAGDNIAVALAGKDKERLTRVFEGLGEGGTIKMPLADQAWGAQLGWLCDKFGVNWMVSIESE